jgi:hypothetical protein
MLCYTVAGQNGQPEQMSRLSRWAWGAVGSNESRLTSAAGAGAVLGTVHCSGRHADRRLLQPAELRPHHKWRSASAVSSSATCRWSLGECRALRRPDHRPGQGPGHRVGLSLPGFSFQHREQNQRRALCVTGGAVENKRLNFEPIITISEETMRQTIVARGFKLKAFEEVGGFIVEVGPVGSDRTAFTSRFARLVDAQSQKIRQAAKLRT